PAESAKTALARNTAKPAERISALLRILVLYPSADRGVVTGDKKRDAPRDASLSLSAAAERSVSNRRDGILRAREVSDGLAAVGGVVHHEPVASGPAGVAI